MNNYITITIRRWKNARAVISQIRNGEWKFRFNPYTRGCCTATRKGVELWVGNGGFFLDVGHSNVFGLIFRHYVWWAAARKARKEEDFRNQMEVYLPDLSV